MTTFILVHLGPNYREHIHDCLSQIRSFNPSSPIYFILPQIHVPKIATVGEKFKINLITCEELQDDPHIKYFHQHSRLNKSNRQGFWTYTTERFHWIKALMLRKSIEDVIHIEYDNLIFQNIDHYLDIFRSKYRYPSESIGALFDNDDRCIPSFMYFPTSKSIIRLIDHINGNLHHHPPKNDMILLADFWKISKLQNNGFIKSLPIIFPEYSQSFVTKTGKVPKDPSYYLQNFKYFGSIFDAAALGQYLGGVDPSLIGGDTRKFENESCIFFCKFLIFKWEKDSEGRDVPYVSVHNYDPDPDSDTQSKYYRINNLHMHSKNLKDLKYLQW